MTSEMLQADKYLSIINEGFVDKPLESRMMANYQVRFGGGRLEKQVKLLAGRLPDLFGINANRVKPELRERLITYQQECYQVLAAAFLDPAAAVERLRQLYRNKGYSDRWIDSRLRTISIRNELTEEWRQRGVEQDAEFAVLTVVINKGTFSVTPSEHKQLKGLNRQNLRDYMTNEELVFTMLGDLAAARNGAFCRLRNR